MKNLKDTVEYKEFGFNIVKCPVCGQDTLDNHYVCDNCGWEYDNIYDEDNYSSANSCSIQEYRNKYFSK